MNNAMTDMIEACRQGCKQAQLTLYERYANKLYNACLRILGNSGEAEEAMQDVFLKIFSRINQYRMGHNFEAWMQRIAVNTAIDYLRRRDVEWEELPINYAAPVDDGDDIEADYASVQLEVQRVRNAVIKLPPGYRVVLSLYLFEGYDMDEIASILKIQPTSVRTQYLRAKRKLLELLTNNNL
ncbi:MAG: RNA polymerase sigma factor [Tannerellaceae bacterium]|jgi:RNA polymerase sigma-70 factor (ECF subfamily)|nr:RNA polymerase sigma factor [Tannerellaceae bacterium]